MTNLKKKVLAGILSGVFVFSGGIALVNAEQDNSDRFFKAQPRSERPQMTDEQLNKYAAEVADYYGVEQSEVATALKDGVHFGDIKQAAMLSKISGKSFAEVFSLKTDWWQVAEKLGVTREQIDAFMEDEKLADLSKKSKLDKKIVNDLLKDNYNPRDICIAGLIADSSKKNVKTIIAKRKINNSWEDVAKEYGVDLKKLTESDRPQREGNGEHQRFKRDFSR